MSISLDQLSNVLYSLFLLYAKNEDYQNILKLSCGPLFFTSYNAFLKKLRCLELASLPHFLMIFEEKYFSFYILLPDQISLSDGLCFVRYWAICALQLFFLPGCDTMNFETNLVFLIKPFLKKKKKSRQKLKHLDNKKSF